MRTLILGSSSPYRRALLERLEIPFSSQSPSIDESRRQNEPPADLALRLAKQKATAVAATLPPTSDAVIIGSDQVAALDNLILGKPGNRDNAIKQLLAMSGQTVTFQTGLAVFDTRTRQTQALVEPFYVQFRQLTEEQIVRYVDREKPFDCAGSFKSEGYGIVLFAELTGRDPTALVGLPLIQLTSMLRVCGFALP